MYGSYIVMAFAFLAILAIKYYLVHRTYENKLNYFVEPKKLSEEIVEKTIKEEGQKILRERFSQNNLIEVIKTNLAFLRIAEPNRPEVLMKLRNISLYIELLKNKDVVGEKADRSNEILRQILTPEKKYLQALCPDVQKPTLQQAGIYRYVRHLAPYWEAQKS